MDPGADRRPDDQRLVITGYGVVSASGVGVAGHPSTMPRHDGVAAMFEEPLPVPSAPVLVDFDVRAHLGRKGTSFYDRATALAAVACGAALADGSVVVDTSTSARIGLVLGTTLGSFKSTSDYSKETLVAEKPYMVNPVLFPNTVMNCAAGQAAIRYGLRGVNSTIAGGPLAFHHALRYAANALLRGHVDVMLAGAVEEFSPHRAWHVARAGARRAVSGTVGPAGEGVAVFVLERADAPRRPGTAVRAEVLATASGFGAGARAVDALADCVRRVLARTGVPDADVSLVLTGEAGEHDRSEFDPVVAALGHEPRRQVVSETLGECDAATGALGLAALLAAEAPAAGSLVLLTARTPDGGVGVALLRGAG